MHPLCITKTHDDNNHLGLAFDGDLDENARITPYDLSETKNLWLDLSKIQSVSSHGVKHWVTFIKHLNRHPDLSVELRGCSNKMVTLFNTVQGCLPTRFNCHSFQIPIYCSMCDQTFYLTKTFPINDDDTPTILSEIKNASVQCRGYPQCSPYLEVDVDLKTYLKCFQ